MSDKIYLYLKTHNKTGLKYLGITKKNPYKYKGSGLHWKRHLKIHGEDHSTEILHECDDTNVKVWGEYYSKKYDIVNSEKFANMRPETGYSGSGMYGKKHTNETKKKISHAHLGKPKSPEAVESHRRALLKKYSDPNYINPLKNRPLSKATRKKISDNHHDVSGNNNPMWGRHHNEETRTKLSEKAKNRKTVECAYCHKICDISNFSRWHGENCKSKLDF